MDGQFSDSIVIGGGMAGLACASELARSGASVIVLDKDGSRVAVHTLEGRMLGEFLEDG